MTGQSNHSAVSAVTFRKILMYAAGILAVLTAAFFLVKRDVSCAGNETSRLAVIQSLGDHGTFDISGSIFKTPDKASYQGRLLGDKPPLLTWLSAGQYYGMSRLLGITFRDHYSLTIFLLYLPYFLLSVSTGVVFYYGLKRYVGRSSSFAWRAAAGVLSVISTLLFSYSVTICNHTVCALLLMILLLQLDTLEKKAWPLGKTFLCGVTCGLIFNCEFVFGGVFGAGVFFFCITAKAPDTGTRIRRALTYAAGAFLLLGIEGIMNYITYGSPLPLYLLTHKPDMAHKDYLFYAWNVLFGFEGFFLYMPACLFLFPVLCRKFPGRSRVCVCMLLCCLAAAVMFLIVTSDYGGFCYGFRFLIPAAPVMLFYIFLSFHAQRSGNRLCKVLFCIALLWGVITSFFGTFNPWNSGYEGSLTPKGNVNETIRNGFLVNVLVFCWETVPDSFLTEMLVEKVYGPDTACYCVTEELLNRNRKDDAVKALDGMQKRFSGPAE